MNKIYSDLESPLAFAFKGKTRLPLSLFLLSCVCHVLSGGDHGYKSVWE